MRQGVNILIVVLLGIVAFLIYRQNVIFSEEGANTLTAAQIDSLLASDRKHTTAQNHASRRGLDVSVPHHETFDFDPNTADTTQLKRLGFPRFMIRSIMKYRAAGGRYQSTLDVKSIYGMTPELYERIEPHIVIDPRFLPYDRSALRREREAEYASKDTVRHVTRKFGNGHQINLNTADSATLTMIPGIGSGRAQQIMIRRRQLGGFHNTDQLDELVNFPDSLKKWFMVSQSDIKRINLNTASYGQIKQHPYMGQIFARYVMLLRRQKGRINSADELRMIPDIDSNRISHMIPYISF